jgi:hypothetical protein
MQGNRMGIGRKFKGLYGAINALTGDFIGDTIWKHYNKIIGV